MNEKELDAIQIDAFAKVMKNKMDLARSKGRRGFRDIHPDVLREQMLKHIEKGDPVDVANYCMMLWYHGASTTEIRYDDNGVRIQPALKR